MWCKNAVLDRGIAAAFVGLLAAAAAPVRSQAAPLANTARDLNGVVIDATGAPVRDAEITLAASSGPEASTTARRTRTGTDGAFSFAHLMQGAVRLNARRLGYRPLVVVFLADTMIPARPMRITMELSPLQLDTVQVEAMESSAMREFNERRRIRRSGHFVVKADIDRRRPAYTSEMLRTIPGMLVRPSTRVGNIVRVRGCRPALWLDGVQVRNAELDEVSRPMDIAGMEVYNSSTGAPPQYSDRLGTSCGAIIIWTRIR